MAKLTISMDEDIVRAAKQLAAEDNVSVSAMFRRYILSRLKTESPKIKIGPLTKKATGTIPARSDEELREIFTDAMMEKYGL